MVELEEYDLIERVKQGQGKPAKIYVKKIPAADDDSGEGTENDSILPEVADLQTSEKSTCRLPVSKCLDFPKGDGNYTDKNYTEFSYIKVCGSDNGASLAAVGDRQSSPTPNYGAPETAYGFRCVWNEPCTSGWNRLFAIFILIGRSLQW